MEDRFISVKEYARIHGISTAAVYNRRSRERILLVKASKNNEGEWLVDTWSYNPGKSGRPKKEGVI